MDAAANISGHINQTSIPLVHRNLELVQHRYPSYNYSHLLERSGMCVCFVKMPSMTDAAGTALTNELLEWLSSFIHADTVSVDESYLSRVRVSLQLHSAWWDVIETLDNDRVCVRGGGSKSGLVWKWFFVRSLGGPRTARRAASLGNSTDLRSCFNGHIWDDFIHQKGCANRPIGGALHRGELALHISKWKPLSWPPQPIIMC